MTYMYACAGVHDEASDKNVKAYAALTLISASCHGILNTSLIKPEPKKDKEGKELFGWFDEVKSRLDDAKLTATDWLDNIVTKIQADIPTCVISYNDQFQATADIVVKLCKEHPDMQKGDADFNKISSLLQELITTIDEEILRPIDDNREALRTWGASLQKAHDNLSEKVQTIQDAETEIATDIERLNTSIDTLNDMIDSEQTLVAVGAGLVGGGIFVAVVGVALCMSGVGAVAGGLVIGVGAAMVIGGAVTWGVMQHKIDAQYKEIAEDRKEIAADQQLLASLKGIETSVNSAVTYMQTALSALDEVKTTWQGFRNLISDTIVSLEKAEQRASAVAKEMFVETARNQWNDAEEMAKKLLDVKVEVKKQEDIGDKAA